MSKIEVNTVDKASGSTVTIGGSGTNITLGTSGQTVTIPSGVTITNSGTQSGFGRTGSVDWQTGSIKTSNFTAANGEGYFVNTTSGTVTMSLPAGVAGYIVSVQDYANTFDSNKLTISPNGSEKINGGNGNIELTTEGEGLTLVYVDSTQGWRSIQDSSFADVGQEFTAATGGTETTTGNFKIHTFTSSSNFVVSSAGTAGVSYLVLAGGGGGGGSEPGYWSGGGGGAGGYRESKSPLDSYTASPTAATGGLSVTAQTYPITVGAGGGPGTNANPGDNATRGGTGSNSIFSTITSAGGGGGGKTDGRTNPPGPQIPGKVGQAGGSGSGAGGGGGESGGAGNTPPVSPSQGNAGAAGSSPSAGVGGGGGGAGGAAGSQPGSHPHTTVGAGVTSNITNSPVSYGTGGSVGTSTAGTANRGIGGGSGSHNATAGSGGSGIVVIRYKYQ